MISKSLGSSRKFHAVLAKAGRLGEFAQLLFPLIVVNTDDHGRMPGDAFTVKHLVLPTSPRSEEAFAVAMDVLAEVNLIRRYIVDGVIYLQINDFDAHQVGLHKRRDSRLPEYPGVSGNYRESPSQGKGTEGKGREPKGTELNGSTSSAAFASLPSPSALDESDKNLGVIVKLAHEALDIEGLNADLGQLADAVKSLCAIRAIDYNGTVVRKALDSALVQRRRPA